MSDSPLPTDLPAESDLEDTAGFNAVLGMKLVEWGDRHAVMELPIRAMHLNRSNALHGGVIATLIDAGCGYAGVWVPPGGSEEHTSELQSLMRSSYAVFCLKKKKNKHLRNVRNLSATVDHIM